MGTKADSLIFPEWSDYELNAEMWDSPKAAVKITSAKRGDDLPPDQPFLDPHSFTLPYALNCHEWKRPEMLFPGKTFVVYKESSVNRYTELIARNKHLLVSPLIRSIVYSIGTLEHLGFTQQWPIEGVTAGYWPTTADEPWKPWHHIYSLCKAGKGQKHRPLANGYGKYIIRIFWLGAWRKMIVDDFIPVDQNGMILLPSTASTSRAIKDEAVAGFADPETNMVELWPFLLSKAIVKMSNLTWTEVHDQLEFSVMVCLTGWICQKINTLNLEPTEIWEICATYAKNFNDANEHAPTAEKPVDVPPYFLMAEMVELRYTLPETGPSIGPCYRHSFLINQIRTTESCHSDKQDLPMWKRFRWMRWATDNGVQDEEASSVRQMELVDFFYPQKQSKRNRQKLESKSDMQSVKRLRMNKSGDIFISAPQVPIAPKTWVNFFEIAHLIEMLMLFHRPEASHCQINVSDLAEKYPPVGERDRKKAPEVQHVETRIVWPYKMKHNFNEPLYLYMDSLDLKTITLAFSSSGNRQILEQKSLVEFSNSTSLRQMSFSILERSKMRTIASIVIEKFDWSRNEFQEFIMGFNTVGCKSLMRLLDPGRVILRVWLRTNSSYSLTVLSDTVIESGKMEDILKLQCRESDRLLQSCYHFGTCFGNLVQAFGTDNYRLALRMFHKSYRPRELLDKAQSVCLEDMLFNCLEETITSTHPECGDILFALRVLFIKPCYGIRHPPKQRNKSKEKSKRKLKSKSLTSKEHDWNYSESLNEILVNNVEECSERQMDIAAVKIQSYFRMWYVQRLRQYHDQAEPLNAEMFESLRKLYKDQFNLESRTILFTRVLRKFLQAHEGLSQLYPFGEDLKHVVNVVSFDGEQACKANSWCPIARYIFYINSPLDEAVRIYLVCNMPQYVFKVYDNDTRRECLNSGQAIEVNVFASNEKGYTLLAHGFTHENQDKMAFHISFVTLRRSEVPPLIINNCPCKTTEINAVYHHNVNAVIGKCILTITQDVFLTLRLTCSYENVRFLLRCLDARGKVVQEKRGTHRLIIPVLELEHCSRYQAAQSNSLGPKLKRSSSAMQRRRSSGERGSSAGSVATRSTRQSKPSKSKDAINPPTECKFFIEMYVLNGTWPLTPLEWLESDKLRKRNLLGAGGKAPRSANCDHMTGNYDLMPDPKWSLQVIHSEEDKISMVLDQRRDLEIQEIKMQWYKDPKRYSASKLLREEYYQTQTVCDESESYITSVFYTGGINSMASSNSQDTLNTQMQIVDDALKEKSSIINTFDDLESPPDQSSPGRMHDRPATRSMMKLAPLNLSSYALPVIPVGTNTNVYNTESSLSASEDAISSSWQKFNPCLQWSDTTIVKNSQDWEVDLANIEQTMAAFESYHDAYVAKMRELRERSLLQNTRMEAHFADVHAEGLEFVNKAYAMRAQCIEKLATDTATRKKHAHETNKLDMSKSTTKSSKNKRKTK